MPLSFTEQRAHIMDGFCWADVVKTMNVLDWTWGSPPHVPTVDEMKSTADQLLQVVYGALTQNEQQPYFTAAQGGFEVIGRRLRNIITYELSFKAAWQESQWEDPQAHRMSAN